MVSRRKQGERNSKTFTWGGSETGTSLVEALVSTGVTAFGVLAVAVLFLYGTRLQTVSRDGSSSTELAVAQLEYLRVLPTAAAQRQNGGSLTSDVANYFTTVGNFKVRWTVANGPATTKDVIVSVRPINAIARPAQIEGLLWR
jgi:hypothetical protein